MNERYPVKDCYVMSTAAKDSTYELRCGPHTLLIITPTMTTEQIMWVVLDRINGAYRAAKNESS